MRNGFLLKMRQGDHPGNPELWMVLTATQLHNTSAVNLFQTDMSPTNQDQHHSYVTQHYNADMCSVGRCWEEEKQLLQVHVSSV